MDASRIPVIIGVGQVNDRPSEPAQGMDSMDLMVAALREAERDSGANWLARLDSLAVIDQISCRELGVVAAPLAAALGAAPRRCTQTAYPMGDSPILLLNEAANSIAAGEVEIAAVVGGEALRTAAARAAAASGEGAPAHDVLRAASERGARSYGARFGLIAPVDIYPLYENAARACYGQTLEQGQAESAHIWSLFSQVAEDSDGAWIRNRRTAADIATPSRDNRPIAFPYTKLMVANSSVNQGAGFLVTSLALARARGVPEHRLVYVGAGAAAHEPADFLIRDSYAQSASMTASLLRTLAMNDLPVEMIDFVELYSCFPCVPKMARRVIGWGLDRPASVFGGLTFGGGPIGNYMSHAVVGMVHKLRTEGRHGLLFGNGGFATNNHSIVLSRTPPAPGLLPRNFDVQTEADARRGPAPVLVEDYAGPATIETYTAFYERDGSVCSATVVARTLAGGRVLAKVPGADVAGIAFLTNGLAEPVGRAGDVVTQNGEACWQFG